MPDAHDQFDLSDTPQEAPPPSESSESGETLAEAEARLEKEGLPKVHEFFRGRIAEDSEAFGVEAARMAKSIELRYDLPFDAGESKELQSFMEREEALRASTEGRMQAVMEDRPDAPTPESLSKEADLRTRRAALDREWEILAEIVAVEGEGQSDMMRFAQETGEELPPMSDAGKRLNEVLREIRAIDNELAAAPSAGQGEAPEKVPPVHPQASPEGADQHPSPTEEKPPQAPGKAIPPPPPGSPLRAEWLRMRSEAESDPAKRQEWTMKYLEELHGPTEKPAEAKKPAEKTGKEGAATPNTPEMWQALYPDEDFGVSEEEKKVPQANTPEMWQALYPDENFGAEADTEEQKEKRPQEAAKTEERGAPPETLPVAENGALPENPMELLVSEGADEDVELPLEIEERPSEEPPSESELKRDMAEEVGEILQAAPGTEAVAGKEEEPSPENAPEPEPAVTHSERHDGNAETFTRLNKELPDMLDTIAEKGGQLGEKIDLNTVRNARDLLRAMTQAGILRKEESMALAEDKARANALFNVVFRGAMKKRNKRKR